MRGISAKLLGALLVSVTLPLAAAAVLNTLAVDSAFQVGVNRRVHQALERAPEAYRALFDALKADFEHSTDAIAASPELARCLEAGDREALREHLRGVVESREDLLEIRLLDEREVEVLAVGSRRADPTAFREWEEARPIEQGGRATSLVAVWMAPGHLFQSFQDAGETLDEYETLEQGRFHVRNRYVAVYLAMIGAVLLLAVGLGIMVSRGVTMRIRRMAEATKRVADGDLSTRVPEEPADEVGQLGAAFNSMVERLHESRERIEYLQRVAAWQQLARRLAHEIKNPLTPIQLAVQELSDRYKGDDPAFRRVLQQATEIVTEEVEALRRLTSEFSAFAKLPDVNPERVKLRTFLEEASASLGLLATNRAEVEVRLPRDERLEVEVDRMLMRRVLDNLVRNAVEAIEGSGVRGKVEVRGGMSRGGVAFIAVEDDGPGISLEDRARVFEPYYTTKDSGTGLGLAIVKKIVLEHGGVVALEPRKSGGTRFVVRLFP